MARARRWSVRLAIGITGAAIMLIVVVTGRELMLSSEPRGLASDPPTHLSASQGIEGRLRALALDRLKCGTYYLSYPEKCLIDGDYVPRYQLQFSTFTIDP